MRILKNAMLLYRAKGTMSALRYIKHGAFCYLVRLETRYQEF